MLDRLTFHKCGFYKFTTPYFCIYGILTQDEAKNKTERKELVVVVFKFKCGRFDKLKYARLTNFER